MKVIACIIARTNSTRLPIKVLRDCGFGYSMLVLLIKRLKKRILMTYTFVLQIIPLMISWKILLVKMVLMSIEDRLDEVIERMVSVAKITKADILLRITGDNLTSIEYIDKQVSIMKEKN